MTGTAVTFPRDLKYTQEHEWVSVEGNVATVGITYYAQEELGDIVYVELPEAKKPVIQFAEFGVVESVKTVSNLYSPCSGEVIEINKAVVETPELVNDDPYDGGWLIKLRMSDPRELDELMTSAEYEEFLEELSQGASEPQQG